MKVEAGSSKIVNLVCSLMEEENLFLLNRYN